METEEYEHIPWANLVAEQPEGVDRRIYVVGAAIAGVMVFLVGMRFLGGGGQTTAPPAAGIVPPTTLAVEAVSAAQDFAETATTVPLTAVSEAELRADDPAPKMMHDSLAAASAEWFVTDWFTVDGSAETLRSVKAALSPALASADIPHEAEDAATTFVEWARTVQLDESEGGVVATVLYRAIRHTDDGFVRDPVATVTIALERSGSWYAVAALPSVVG